MNHRAVVYIQNDRAIILYQELVLCMDKMPEPIGLSWLLKFSFKV